MSSIQKAGRFIVMLWGAPAAGKTTVARSLLRELRRRRGLMLPHLSTDQLNRAILGEDFVGDVREALYDGLIAMAGNILGAGGGVLLDGTFLYPEMRERIRNLARERRAVLVSVQVACTLSTRRQRNAQRPDAERVPEAWLERAHYRAMAGRFHGDLVLDTETLSTEEAVEKILELMSWRLERGNRFPALIRQVMPGKTYCAGL
ncbi:ATP-binding protein [bacterium CPR1]|nr:ATP-binding protein [bacterium CPR1]